jgi:hypothetical protein
MARPKTMPELARNVNVSSVTPLVNAFDVASP